jgi:hypothetical protein
LILSRPEITIGHGESCDIGLFGDAQVEKLHCRIIHEGDDYVLVDEERRLARSSTTSHSLARAFCAPGT